MRTTSGGGVTMMIIVAVIIICITIGAFYTSEKRKMEKKENGTLETSKRERLINIIDEYAPLEKIISKKIHCNGTVEIIEKWNDDKDKDLLTMYEEMNDDE